MRTRLTWLAVLALTLACGREVARESAVQGLRAPRTRPSRFAECDGNASTVCETDVSTDPANCGACGRPAGNGLACASGVGVAPEAVAQVVAGTFATCVRRASGNVECWGWNAIGQLGDGTTTDRLTPAPALVQNIAELFTWSPVSAAADSIARWCVGPGCRSSSSSTARHRRAPRCGEHRVVW